MKKREEMLRDLHRRMDEYESERRMKRAKMAKVAASVTPVCAAAVVGVGLWKGGVLTSNHDQLINSTVESTASDVIVSADNDSSADKHSANTKNTANKNGEPTTSESTADRQVATSDAAIPRTTENGENVIEDSDADNASVEANTPVADDRGALVSDNSTITNTEPQRATEAPAVQTEAPVQQTTPPVQQTEPASQSVPDNSGNPSNGGSNMWCLFRCTIEWNGVTYNDNTEINASAYTQDKYIGKVSDFKGEYKDSINYLIHPDDSVYTTKENPYVLLVVKAEPFPFYGSVIAMTNPAFLDGVVYRPHTEDVPYEDIQVWN
ncbi:hypothetical protein [Ruminococcus sp. XPD3002]|uniref:hypothetical protein n=1 Tax=Ruminococcus sp. XPD3002 TaxID=1452269 RepID=UPI00091C4B3B|nr:hypothetical protein SAMN04487832_13015 [Ruminococcus flavefaciens]